MHLVINQPTDRTEQVTGTCIDKLYNLSKNNTLDSTSYLRGSINTAGAYEDAVTFLNTMWGPDLIVTASAYYIRFADQEVESVLKTALNKAEGEGITTQEAATTNLGTVFKNNTDIVSFNEFTYFTRPNTTVDFTGCSNLERIDITNCAMMPNFSDCSSLAYFNGPNSVQGVMMIPEGITSISSGRLAGCASITELHFSDSLTTLGSDSCRQMTNLTKIYFGSGMQTCSNPFYGDNALSEVHIPDMDTWLDIEFGDNDHSSPLTKAHHLYVDGVEVTSVDFTGRTSVGTNVLSGGTSITSVVLPSTITSIGTKAFQNCTNLVIADLNLPNLITLGSSAFSNTKIQQVSSLGNITVIPKMCFSGCANLQSVALSSNVTTTGDNSFSGCTSLFSIDLSHITTLGISSFKGCANLASVDISSVAGVIPNLCFEGCTSLTSITIPNTVTSLNFKSFAESGLTSINIPSSVTNVGGNAFYKCSRLTSISFPDTVTTIGDEVVRQCDHLTTVEIGTGITSIGKRAFYIVPITSFKIHATTPPTIGDGAFGGGANWTIQVPSGTDPVSGNTYVDIYKTAWPSYASRILAIQT